MPVLRLFAAAREAAGTASVEVPGVTVDEVLAAARARFGPELGAVIDASKVWRNGEPAVGSDPVGDRDEVAVLPPVSGGSGPGEPDGRRARRTFAPAEPPPSTGRPPAPRRSPRAEAAVRRAEDRRPGTAARRTPAPDGRRGAPGARRAPVRGADPRPGGRRAAPPPRARSGADPRPGGRRAAPPPRARSDADPRPLGRAAPPPREADPAPAREQSAPAPRLVPQALTRTTTPTGTPLAPDADGPGPDGTPATVLTRMRSVGVPVTGSITIRGKERKVSGGRERRTLLGRRYAVVYDTDGPRVTLGVLWFIAIMGAVALGWWVLTFVFAIAAGWAALEAAERWRERGVAADPWIAALGAAVVAGAGAAGARALGGAIVAVVVVAVARVALGGADRDRVLSAAGSTIGCAVPFGLAAAAVILTYDLEIGAVVALLLFASAYEAGDYLIGSGSSNSVEGPLTGIVTIGVVALVIALLAVPPFDGVPAYTFAAFAAVACPLGQLAASAILPASDAHAPSVRRLDSYLLLAPVWVWAVGVFMASR